MDNSVDRSDWHCFLMAVGSLHDFDWSGGTFGGRMVVHFPLFLPTGELNFQFNQSSFLLGHSLNPGCIPGLDQSTVFPRHMYNTDFNLYYWFNLDCFKL